MPKFKLFLENFLVYGIGGIISKIIPLVMVPVVTRLMPDSGYYGISDLSNTVVSFASSLAVMGMYDAMYRMFFERDNTEYRKSVCSTALCFTAGTSVIVFAVMILCRNWIAELFFRDKKYAYIVYLSAMATLVGATNSIISAPTRMQNKRKIFLVTNTLSPLISYAVTIPMLLAGYYTIALPLAAVISGVTMEMAFGVLNRGWFRRDQFDREILKQLLVIAVPLLPNFLIYWVFNSSDKVMLTNLAGVGAAGIYSVGSKLGHASQLIYTAFAGGWQFFAFSTMKEKNQVESNSRIYEYLGLASYVCTAFLCAVSYPVYRFLFPEEYLPGYVIAPYLFLAPLLQMLYQVGNNQFLVIKKTWPGMFILSGGAIVNILLNLVLIPGLGIEGAAIATLAGYIVTDVVDMIVLTKCGLMKVSLRFWGATAGIIVYFLLWRLLFPGGTGAGLSGSFALCILFAALYRADLALLVKAVRQRKREGR